MHLVTVGRPAVHKRRAHARTAGNVAGELDADDAVNLDGGGSSTLVFRKPGAGAVTIVNDPSDPSPRLVPNGIGVWVG
jgi:hypothetical protein